MKNLRSLVRMVTAAVVSAPLAVGVSAPAQAVPANLKSYICTRISTDVCHFNDFKATSVPDLTYGQTGTISGVGAVEPEAAGEPLELTGGFRGFDAEGNVSNAEFHGKINPDGTWSVTVTAPSKKDAAGLVEIYMWVTVRSANHAFQNNHEALVDLNNVKTGWYQEGGAWFWGDAQGVKAKGWKQIGGAWYYFNPQTSVMATGWLKDGANWYYLKANGAMATGWVKLGETWYYLKANGAMATGWVKLGQTWYYLKADGSMVTGRQMVEGRWSLFAVSGAWLRYA